MAANGFDDDQTRSFTALAAGTIVSHYKIISKIGVGGMGEVYLAEDTQLDRKVALKFLPLHLSQDEAARARFTREAKAAAKLDHPNIVQVYEVSEFQGRPFFAMAHIEGKSLKEVIKEGKLSINEAIEFTKQICEGLHKAHESGIVHRDIKPGNIIIDKDNKARILDFGLATVAGEDKLTKTGSTLGTVGYMSPEQIEGKQVDHRSDLFSVGVILYEMLTGRRPFEGDNDAAVARSITDAVPEPIARYKSGTTGELQQIVDKALAKDPSLRYQHADGMLADLKRLRIGAVLNSTDRSPQLWKPTISVSAVLVVVIVVSLILKPWKIDFKVTDEVQAHTNRLAVMYFDNLADPGDSLKLGEIATNLLITDLSQSEHLSVVSSQRLYDLVEQFREEGQTASDRDAATQLASAAGARWLLVGSILKAEPYFILTSELVDASSGEVVASERIQGEPGQDIFPIIDSLTVEIKKDLQLSPEALEEPDPAVAGITTNSVEAYRHYLSAMHDYGNMRWFEMANNLKACLAIDSTFAMAYFWASYLATGETRKDLISKAVKYSNQASEKERLYILGRKASFDRKHSQFVDFLRQITRRYPDEKEAYFLLGNAYHAFLNQPEKAIPEYLEAIRVDPRYATAYNHLSSAYADAGDFENSIRRVEEYVQLADSSANAFDSRGEIYSFAGNIDKAIESFQIAVEREPDFWASLHHLGQIHLFRREYEAAEESFRRLVYQESVAYRTIGRLSMASIPIHQGKLAGAIEVLNNGIAQAKMEHADYNTATKHFWKTEIFREWRDYTAAMGSLDTAMTIYRELMPGREIELEYRRIELLADQKKYEVALEAAEDFKSRMSDDSLRLMAEYWYVRSYLEFSRGNFERAVEFAERACNGSRISYSNYSNYFRLHALLGRAYLALGHLGDAVRELERISTLYSHSRWLCPISSVKIHYWLGTAYEASGWKERAIEQFETFLSFWSDGDEGLDGVDDAQGRLARLKGTI